MTNFDGTVSRFKLDGKPAGTFKVTTGGLLALAFDGANIWVPNDGGTVTKLRASDGKDLGTFTVGCDGSGVAFDGVDLWLTSGPYIIEVRPADGAVLHTKRLNQTLQSVAFDGANIWVAGWGADRAFKL